MTNTVEPQTQTQYLLYEPLLNPRHYSINAVILKFLSFADGPLEFHCRHTTVLIMFKLACSSSINGGDADSDGISRAGSSSSDTDSS